MKDKKWHSIILIIIILIATAAVILPKELNNLDEIWNFNFAKNISDGKVPYKDFNIVTTPLLSIICGIILKIVGKELIVTRILAVILITAILYTVYKILEQLKVSKYYRYLVLFIIYALSYPFFCLDYNFSNLLITLIIILLELKRTDDTENILKPKFKYDLLVGILAGAAILFKQTTGIAVALIYAFYKIIFIKEKEQIKDIIKLILARVLGICVPIIIFVIYLLINNAWTEFLDYAVFGVKTFNNQVSYITLFKNYGIYIAILSIILPIAILYSYLRMAIKENKEKEDIQGTILCAFSAASFVAVFPISDSMHFSVGAMPSIILLIFLICRPIRKSKDVFKLFMNEFIKMLTILGSVILTVICIRTIYSYISTCNNFKDVKHFYYIPIYRENDETLREYILEKEKDGIKVYILDASAPIYTIPIDRYYKNYDMFLKGALGAEGEEGQIKNLENETNIEVLILKDKYHRNWQVPEGVIKHIQKNWIKADEIDIYDIYVKE